MRFFAVLLIAASACLMSAPAWAKRVALVVGNAAYTNAPTLRNPGNDAADLAASLRSLGFDVTEARDLDKPAFERALQDFGRAARGADAAVFFYAGHAISHRGESWMLPITSRLEAESDIAFEAIPADLVVSAVSGASGMRLIILDACRDNPFVASMAPSADGTRSASRGLTRVDSPAGTVVWYAAQLGSTAADGSGRNSPFTGALLKHISTPGLELDALFREVVSEVTTTTANAQTPFRYGTRGRGDFFFNPKQAGQNQADATTQTTSTAGLSAIEKEAWAAYELVRPSQSIVALRRVAERYPGTLGGDAAAADADALEAGKTPTQPVVEPRNDAEQRAWRALDGRDDVAGLVAFLEWYPDGPYSDAARQQLIELYREAQRELRRLGLYRSRIDGDWGGGSERALRAFQRDKGFSPADGVLTERLLIALRAEPTPAATASSRFRDGQSFQDCRDCPEMVVIPSGSFTMGSPTGEYGRDGSEGPQQRISVGRFAAGRTEVTRGQFRAFVNATGYNLGESCWTYDNGWREEWGRNWLNTGYRQTDDHPIVCVHRDDAEAYTRWLSSQTGHSYRLLTEAEWEYAARAGSNGSWFWGSRESDADPYMWFTSNSRGGTQPAGSKRPNAFGLYDVHGNTWEWVQDCWNASLNGAPSNGAARMNGDCSLGVMRSGSWRNSLADTRSARRAGYSRALRDIVVGFRIARDL